MMITSMTEVGDSLWISGMERDIWMSVGTVAATQLSSLARTGSRDALRLDRIAVPSPYRTNPIMFGALGHVDLDVGASDIVVGFSGTPYLLVARTGQAIDTDPQVERAAGGRGPEVTGTRFHVSSVSPDGARQCADTEIPMAAAGRPRVALEGSLLLVVDQIPTARSEVSTVLRRFEVDPSSCDGTVRTLSDRIASGTDYMYNY